MCFDSTVVLVPWRQGAQETTTGTVAVKTVVVYRDPLDPLDLRKISERPVLVEARLIVENVGRGNLRVERQRDDVVLGDC